MLSSDYSSEWPELWDLEGLALLKNGLYSTGHGGGT